MLRAVLLAGLLAASSFQSAKACQTALILAMDVSNSVDPGEYRLQIDGLAAALTDPEISEIIVRDQVALSVIQWSGTDKQEVSIDWVQAFSAAQVADLAARVRGLERAFILSNTAPAEALSFGLKHFQAAPKCARLVVDMSGDGTPNSGTEVSRVRRSAERQGITVNGLAIEGLGIAITNFYRRSVITSDGFVITARGHRDYARAIRIKLLRELSQVLG
ncbi:DUF1194 domain-containing protein [Thalassococcus lentus]|uniref:DUF1194 domain-containing protein n=1 Tax=Thalassococcus lentus TaxID=1210524 RepID=A0ABT4XR55_9RHOB|nr:DUF1194 domain-containing protein [Thalassococcus lentus]MDA7424382.1 DUF1194 domain-containing protein [Thalassococcus lentus]